MLDILLVGTQASSRVLLAKLGCQFLDDNVGIANLLSIQLHEGEHAPLRSEFGVVVDVLQLKHMFIHWTISIILIWRTHVITILKEFVSISIWNSSEELSLQRIPVKKSRMSLIAAPYWPLTTCRTREESTLPTTANALKLAELQESPRESQV